MGCSWAVACGVQGRGNIARLPAQLVELCMAPRAAACACVAGILLYFSGSSEFSDGQEPDQNSFVFCNHTNNVLLLYYRTMCKFFGALVVALWTYFGALFLFLP